MGTYSGNAETDKPSPKADTRHISIPTFRLCRRIPVRKTGLTGSWRGNTLMVNNAKIGPGVLG